MTTQKPNYMKEADDWISDLFYSVEEGVDLDADRRAVKDKLLQSFRNGQRMCPKCNPRPPIQKAR